MNLETMLRTAMKLRGVTQEKLAEKLGYAGPSAVRKLLTRPNGIRSDVLTKTLDAMGYEVVIRDKISGKDLCVLELPSETEEA